jgi:hypothetical protein
LPSKDTDSFSFDNYVDEDTIKLQANVARMQEEFTTLVQLLTKEREQYKQNEELHKLERDNLIQECTNLKDAMRTSASTINQMKLEFQGKIGDQAKRIEILSSHTKHPLEPDKDNTKSISSPIQKLLDNYYLLDEDSKKGLFYMTMTTNNEHYQRAIIQLQEEKLLNQTTL